MSSNQKALCVLLSAFLLYMTAACTAKTQGASGSAIFSSDTSLSAISDDTASNSISSDSNSTSLPASSGTNSTSLSAVAKQENPNSKSVTSNNSEKMHFQVNTINKTTTEDNIKIETSVPQFSGFGASSELNKKLSKIVEDRLQENKDYIKTLGEKFRKGFWLNSSFEYNQNGNILSVWLTVDDYTGGAHGSTYVYAFNVNIKTDEFYDAPYSMFENKNAAKTEITDKAVAYFKNHSYLDEDENNQIIQKIKNKNGNFQFYLEKDNLVVYFNTYEIMCGACGVPKFKLPLSDFQSKLVC